MIYKLFINAHINIILFDYSSNNAFLFSFFDLDFDFDLGMSGIPFRRDAMVDS